MSNVYAILPSAVTAWQSRKAEAFAKIPRADAGGDNDDRKQIKEFLGLLYNQRREMAVTGGVATIHVNDFLGGDLTFLDKCLGASDYSDIGADVIKAANDPAVKSIVLDINSPGGDAIGCVEIGRLVAEVAKSKPIKAVISRIGCSAAYAIACGANEIVASPSAQVGSIGTILSYLDIARLCEAAGIKPHVFTNAGADLKASGSQWKTPSAEEEKHLQETVDRYGSDFRAWVSERRKMTADAFRGQAASGEDAKKLNFIDSIQPTSTTPPAQKPTAASVKSVGAAAFSAVTNPDPIVRGPAVSGLNASLVAAARPDFAFLRGMERVRIAAEFERLGGLSEATHKLYMYRRRQYCEQHHLTPEQVSGSTTTIIPEMIPKAEVKTREATVKAKRELPALRAAMDKVNAKVAASVGSKTELEGALYVRSLALRDLNKAESLLGLTLTK